VRELNGGKICVAVFAVSADELVSQLSTLPAAPDLAEIRFDCLSETEVTKALNVLSESGVEIPLLATFRPAAYGGSRDISQREREEFWRSIDPAKYWGADLEPDIFPSANAWVNRVLSFHSFHGPADPAGILQTLRTTSADFIKIAMTVSDACDAIPLWNLMKQEPRLIPIAMGEAGKWTRLLGLAHGSAVTYASTLTGRETAPGQISADDLDQVYRVREISRETSVYGVLAGDTSYSMSPFMHNAAFRDLGIDAVFVPFQTGDIGNFLARMVNRSSRQIEIDFKGFAVTNPHKTAIIPHLDRVDEIASRVGAVNTVTIEDDPLVGTNTDVAGFVRALGKVAGDLRGARVLVLGAGGAARACVVGLLDQGAEVAIAARRRDAAQKLAGEFEVASGYLEQRRLQDLEGTFDIIVNATPSGTLGLYEAEAPIDLESVSAVKIVFDLIYNPVETRLMKDAVSLGIKACNGLEMLIEQAAAQFRLWTGADAPIDVMRTSVESRLGSAGTHNSRDS
jgi:3-dehydroquinate dehydratase/shikimate dehydrogenase